MKKMMIFAVMMSMMLMPAQMMAKNNNREFAKPKVENRVKRNEQKAPKMKFDNARPSKPDKKFNNRDKGRKPMPPVARRPRRPMPRPVPVPPPPPVHHHHHNHHYCDNGAVETAATIIGIAALISAIAD